MRCQYCQGDIKDRVWFICKKPDFDPDIIPIANTIDDIINPSFKIDSYRIENIEKYESIKERICRDCAQDIINELHKNQRMKDEG
jgi:hypothetical protein